MLDFAGKNVTVMGLGRFGGGAGVTRWLAGQGADVLVTDLDPPEKLEASLAAIADLTARCDPRAGRAGGPGPVTLRLGEHNVSDFSECDLVVANPAVPRPWENRFLRAASAAGVPITSEIGLLVRRLPDARSVVGVTGSVGKSTSSAMVHFALEAVLGDSAEGVLRVALGGNIGGSLLPVLDRIDERTKVVLELSSAMLWWLGDADPEVRTLTREPRGGRGEGVPAGWSPGVGLVTNISANHLDWHGEFEHYCACKRLLIESMPADGVAVLVDESVRAWKSVTRARVVEPAPHSFGQEMRLPGAHNRVNAAGALEAAWAVLRDDPIARNLGERGLREALGAAIGAFTGLEHRLQLVAEVGGVKYFNDSKSTTPESCLKALEALRETSARGLAGVHLIAGGYDKKTPLTSVAEAAQSLAGLYTIGVTGPALSDEAARGGARVERCGTLGAAVRACAERARPGDVVLLSPACASWDQYVNFEARGQEFVGHVRRLAAAERAGESPRRHGKAEAER